MIEGGTSKDHKKVKLFLLSEPQKAKEIINAVTKAVIDVLIVILFMILYLYFFQN